MVAYADAAQVRKRGAPSGTLYRSALLCASVDASANTLTIDGHAFETDDPVELVVEPGGIAPGGLAVGTTYYAQPVSGSTSLLKLSGTAGGAAIDLTSAGSGNLSLRGDLAPVLNELCEDFSRDFDDALIAHGSPFTAPYPEKVVSGVCVLVAEHALEVVLGKRIESVMRAADRVRTWLGNKRRTGAPHRDNRITTSRANLAAGFGNGRRTWSPGGASDSGRVL